MRRHRIADSREDRETTGEFARETAVSRRLGAGPVVQMIATGTRLRVFFLAGTLPDISEC